MSNTNLKEIIHSYSVLHIQSYCTCHLATSLVLMVGIGVALFVLLNEAIIRRCLIFIFNMHVNNFAELINFIS